MSILSSRIWTIHFVVFLAKFGSKAPSVGGRVRWSFERDSRHVEVCCSLQSRTISCSYLCWWRITTRVSAAGLIVIQMSCLLPVLQSMEAVKWVVVVYRVYKMRVEKIIVFLRLHSEAGLICWTELLWMRYLAVTNSSTWVAVAWWMICHSLMQCSCQKTNIFKLT